MRLRFLALSTSLLVLGAVGGPVASAEPAGEPLVAEAAAAAAPPPPEGSVVSPPPATTSGPDGWTLTVGAKDETQRPIPPLTTALSTREYEVGGTFTASMTHPDKD